MIASLRGVVQSVGPGELVLEVGGVGLYVLVTTSVIQNAPAVGQMVFVHTRLIVREDSISLFGFKDLEERELFDLLIQVNGVGPRLALAVLSHLSTDVLRSAVGNEQAEVLARVPGIGRKTAEKIVFHLKDRIQAPLVPTGAPSEVDSEVISVLTALGYNLVEAQTAVQSIPAETSPDVEERVRLALQYFARP